MYSAIDRGAEAAKLVSRRESILVSTTVYLLKPLGK